MLFVFPQGRISASKALSHRYFGEFIKSEEEVKEEEDDKSPKIDMQFLQMNLNEYTFNIF